MKNNKHRFIKYYTEFNGSDGHKHYAVHVWDDVLKWSTMMSDLKNTDNKRKN